MSIEEFMDGFVDTGLSPGLMVVDFSQIVISTIMATFRPTEQMSIDLIRHVVINTIRSNVLKHKHEYPEVVIAMDRGPYWRKEIAPYYKGNRKRGKDDSPWDFQLIYEAMDTVKAELHEIFPYKVIQVKGVEADDIAGILVHRFGKRYKRILLISSDSDWAQLQITKNIKQWSPIQKKWVLPKHGSPRLHLMEKVIKGDRKDGIANIKSVSDAVVAGTRQKSVYEKELVEWSVTDPEIWADDFMLARYKENMSLLDLSAQPDHVVEAVIAEFNKTPANGSRIYSYLVKHRMKELLGRAQEFLT